jgi:hypothetical protein
MTRNWRWHPITRVIAKAARDEQQMGDQSRLIDALRELLPILETEAAGVLEAKGRKEAEERLLGIKRAYGSTVATYGEDEKRVQQAVAALGEAITTLNSRARKLEALRAEAAALSDRFSLPVPILTIVSEPQFDFAASLPQFWRLQGRRPSVEADEHRLRERRDYTEISGSPGFDIITKAGLRTFPPTHRARKRRAGRQGGVKTRREARASALHFSPRRRQQGGARLEADEAEDGAVAP